MKKRKNLSLTFDNTKRRDTKKYYCILNFKQKCPVNASPKGSDPKGCQPPEIRNKK